jgi:integrase
VKAKIKKVLTPLGVQKSKAVGRALREWDAKVPGLCLTTQTSGWKSFKLYYSFRGCPRVYNLGPVHLSDARNIAREKWGDIARGRDPWVERRAERDAITFADVAERHLEAKKKTNKSWAQHDRLVRRFLLPAWGARLAGSIVPADVSAVMAKIDAPILANQTVKAASAIFSRAVKKGLVTTNPCEAVERNPTTDRDRVLSDAELPLFWDAFGKAGVPGAALRVLLLLGQRPNEVASMRHDQITAGWWELPGAEDKAKKWPGTKNKKTHLIWLPQQVQTIIAGLSADSDFVFGRPILYAMQETMKDIWKELNVPRVIPHDLRRTHGTRTCELFGIKGGRASMNKIQNHREGGISNVYDRHAYKREIQRVMEATSAHIMSIIEGRGGDFDNVVSMRR